MTVVRANQALKPYRVEGHNPKLFSCDCFGTLRLWFGFSLFSRPQRANTECQPRHHK